MNFTVSAHRLVCSLYTSNMNLFDTMLIKNSIVLATMQLTANLLVMIMVYSKVAICKDACNYEQTIISF